MRSLPLIASAVIGLVAGSQAQVNLNLGQPMTSANQGNPNGAVYFNMTVTNTITWTQMQYVSSDASAAGTSAFNIYFGPSQWEGSVATNPGPWVLIGTTAPVAIVGLIDEVVTGVISGAGPNTGNTVTFAPGNYGIALQAIGHSWGYQNGLFTFTDANISVTTGGASNAFLATPTFTPRSVNAVMTYTLGGTPIAVASHQKFGSGCYANYQTFYEEMGNTATSQDLGNTSLLLTLNTSGPNPVYNVTSGVNAPLAAGAGAVTQVFADNNANVVLPLTVPIQYPRAGALSVALSVEMSADGFISLDGTNTGGNPVLANFLGGGARVGNWHDMDPLVAGTAWFEEDFVLGASIFTWENIPSRGNAGVNTIQILAYFGGNIEMRFGALNLLVGGGWPTMVGYTPGNGSLDPGTRDVSATPYSTQGVDSNPLTLDTADNPVLGTTVNMVTSNPSTSPGVGVMFLSLTPLVGSPLPLGIIGAPGCFANVASLDASFTIDNIPINGMTVPFSIPAIPSLVGASIGGQSIWLDPAANAFGMTLSNGLLLKLGV